MFQFAARTVHVSDSDNRASRRRNTVNGVLIGKENDAGRPPGASDETEVRREDRRWGDACSRGEIESKELALRGNRDLPAVRRPYGLRGFLRALDSPGFEGRKGPNPKRAAFVSPEVTRCVSHQGRSQDDSNRVERPARSSG